MPTSFVSWDTEADQSQHQPNLALLPQPGVLVFCAITFAHSYCLPTRQYLCSCDTGDQEAGTAMHGRPVGSTVVSSAKIGEVQKSSVNSDDVSVNSNDVIVVLIYEAELSDCGSATGSRGCSTCWPM